jgi:cysteine synthase B
VSYWNGESTAREPITPVAFSGALGCQVLRRDGWTILAFDGELDFTHIDAARKALLGLALTRRASFALDLRGVRFMDTTGVRVVLQAMHRAEAHGAEFALIRGPHEVQHVLELVGLTDQLRIVDGPEALGSVELPLVLDAAARPLPSTRPHARAAADIVNAIGNTPLVELTRLSPKPDVRLWAKLESLNPTGSLKDRVARAMIEHAEAARAVLPGQTIIAATSGNTGISLSMVCARWGYALTVVMPDSVNEEHARLVRMYGAEIVFSPGAQGPAGAVDMAETMAAADPSFFLLDQHGNPASSSAHYSGTGLEILQDLGEVAAFVAGVGTGATLSGAGRRLREQLGPAVEIVAVEPVPGGRSLEDVDLTLVDRRVTVDGRDAIAWTRRLLDEEGIFAGVSSGALASVAVQIAGELAGGNVVFLVCDDGWRYLSSGLYTGPLEEVVSGDRATWW